jgi:transmembrane sensor
MSPAEHIEETAARWLLRREEPEWSDADAAGLEAWLEESFAHKAAFWRLEDGWSRAGRMAALRSPEPAAPAARRARRPAQPRKSFRSWRPAAIAASLVVAIAAGMWATSGSFGVAPKTYATEIGGRASVPLEDGSRVELNTATTLRTKVTGGRRQVWLDRGEAYFDVARDEARAFTVDAGQRRVVVLGTRFSVRRDGDRLTVAVVEGRVRVEPASAEAGTAARVLTRGDMVLADGASLVVTHKPVDAVVERLSWREGMLTFDQSTLGEAAAEFNRYNRKQVVVRGAAANVRIGGAFEAGNVDAFARLLRQAYGLQVTDDGSQVTVGG